MPLSFPLQKVYRIVLRNTLTCAILDVRAKAQVRLGPVDPVSAP